ncbi:MAG: FHA domain-containing protein [Eubacteriales bacterium]|nr:FHA domain-containing protein [Eubacteriales bacterium]
MKGYKAMQDRRLPLPVGTKLYCENGEVYTILDEKCQYGGSSLVYSASRSGSRRTFVIKECFPLSEKYLYTRDENGLVRPSDKDDEEAAFYLEKCRKHMLEECEIGQMIADKSGRVIAPWEKTRISRLVFCGTVSNAEQGIYIAMEQVSQKGCFLQEILEECSKTRSVRHLLRAGGLPDIFTVSQIMEEILKALDTIHKSGYIYGDIQSENIIFLSPRFELGEIGTGYLFDFGCAKKLKEDGKTEEIANQEIYSTTGYCPPEIVLHNDGYLRLTPAADIFSAGCLMLYLLKGMHYKWINDSSLPITFRTAYVSNKELSKRGGSPEITSYINEILKQALNISPDRRFQDACEMLEAIQELKALCRPVALKNIETILNRQRKQTEATEESDSAVYILVHISDGRVYRIHRNITKIGKGEDCDIVLSADTASKVHAVLTRDARGVRIYDSHSTNGTFVNMDSIEGMEDVFLGNSAVITLADEEFLFFSNPLAEWYLKEKRLAFLYSEEMKEYKILTEKKMLIGRSNPWKNGTFSSKTVSRKHGEIQYQNGQYFFKVSDKETLNGTFLNTSKERLKPSQEIILLDGDVIRIGTSCHIRFSMMELEEVQARCK